jgi:phage shock protein A
VRLEGDALSTRSQAMQKQHEAMADELLQERQQRQVLEDELRQTQQAADASSATLALERRRADALEKQVGEALTRVNALDVALAASKEEFEEQHRYFTSSRSWRYTRSLRGLKKRFEPLLHP